MYTEIQHDREEGKEKQREEKGGGGWGGGGEGTVRMVRKYLYKKKY